MKTFSFKKFLSLGFIVISTFILTTCGEDSGLGPTIDVNSPELSIEYPPAAALIRGTFTFAGTWNDDKSLARIEVSVKNLDTNYDYGKSLANFDEKHKWSISINKLTDSGFELPDGKYQLDAVAYDNSGRASGTNSRQFEIDNTPPVFVITKPGVIRNSYLSNKSHSKYGSLFAIEGTISDDHEIASMDVTVYDTEGNPVSSEPYTEADISTTGSKNVTIARSVTGSSDFTNKRYEQIYQVGEADSDGNKVYSCTVTLSDATKQYTNPGDSGEGPGNITSTVYLYDDIYDELMSSKKGLGLTANDFRAVLNGSATDSSISGKGVVNTTVSQVKEALASYGKDTSSVAENSLSFSLNPNADPTYNISGMQLNYNAEGTTLSANTNKAMGEQPLTVIISAGLDQVNIIPSSIKLWIKKIGLPEQLPLSKSDLNSAISSLEEAVKNLETSGAAAESFAEVNGWKLLLDNSSDASPTDTNVSVSTKLPGDGYIEAETYYAIVATGRDKDDFYLSQTRKFGFVGTASALYPTIAFTTPENPSFADSSAMVIEGTARENNARNLSSLKAIIKEFDENTGKEIEGASFEILIECDAEYNWTNKNGFSCVYNPSSRINSWTFKPSECEEYEKIKAEATGLLRMYTVTVEAKGTAELTSSAERNFHVDTTQPVIKISSVSPIVSGADYFGESSEHGARSFINGTISIIGNIEIQNPESVKYDIWASTDLTADLTSANSILLGLKDYIADLKSQGILDDSTPDFTGDFGKIYSINKKLPTEIITKYFISKGIISKDQPIKSRIILTATNTVGKSGTYSTNEYNNGNDFIIYQETNKPKIILSNVNAEITNEANVYPTNIFDTSNNNKLSIFITDDDSIVDYEIYIAKKNEEFEATPNKKVEPNKTTDTYSYILPEELGVYKVKIIARDFIRSDANTDENNPTGISKTKEFLIAVDNGAPVLSVKTPTSGDFVSRESVIGVSGTITKKEGTTISGYVYEEANPTNKVDLVIEKIENTTNPNIFEWSGKIPGMPTAGSNFIFEIKAVDTYGQNSSVTLSLRIDDVKPVWLDEPFKIAGEEYTSGTSHRWYKSSTLKFTGQYKEMGSGIDHVDYTIIKAGETTGTSGSFSTKKDYNEHDHFSGEESFSENLGDFIAKMNESEPLPNKITFVATDKAGNKSDKKIFEIYIDSEAPSLESDVTGSQYSNAVTPIEVTGTASDDSSGVAGVKLQLFEDGNSEVKSEIPAISTAASGQSAFTTWKAEIPASALTNLASKPHSVKAIVIDGAGNETKLTIFKIDVDTDVPTIENISFTNTNPDYAVYQPEEIVAGSTVKLDKYYVHNNDGNKFSLYGSIMDPTSGIKSIDLLENSVSILPAGSLLPSSLPIENIDFSDRTGTANLIIRATDMAGNVTDKPITIYFDNTPPKGIHAIDGSNKDIFFRISNLDNWKWNGTEGEIPDSIWNDELDKDLGGKYSPTSFGNNQTVRVRGNISDKDSGVRMIYYKVINTGTVELPQEETTIINDKTFEGLNKIAEKFLENYKTDNDNTGYFSTNKIEEKRVTFSSIGEQDKIYDTNGEHVLLCGTDGKGAGTIFEGFVKDFGTAKNPAKRYATIKTTYDQSFTGFQDGYNYLILVAEDNVGNAALDTVYVVTGVNEKTKYTNFSLNVDTETPELECNQDSQIVSNGTADITINGTFSDNFSGVKTILLEVINNTSKSIEETITINKDSTLANNKGTGTGFLTTSGTWNALIEKTLLANLGTATYTIKATVTDRAGNQWPQNIFNIQLDNTKPEISTIKLTQNSSTYKVYKDEEKNEYYVNPGKGRVTIEGVATDNFGIDSVELSIPGLETIPPAGTGSFSFTVDLSGLTGDSVTATLNATDKAGNHLAQAETIVINFDHVTPELNSIQISNAAYDTATDAINWYKASLLKFDGKYSESGSGIEEIEYTITKAGNGGVLTGSFTSKVLTGDDAGKESFSANLSEFISKAENESGNEWNTVKLVAVDKVGNRSPGNEYKIYIDSTPPEVESNESETLYTDGSGSLTISGTAKDPASGIRSVVIKVNNQLITVDTNDSTGTGKVTLTTSGTENSGTAEEITYSDKNCKWEAVLNCDVLFSSVPATTEAKNFSVTATVTDVAGNSSPASLASIIVDKKAPLVTLAAPADADTDSDAAGTQINGTIELSGTIKDKNVLPEDAIVAIQYTTSASASATDDTGWTSLTASSHAAMPALELTGNSNFSIKNFDTTKLPEGTYYLRAKAQDKAGNTGYSPKIEVEISQASDRPKIQITNLSNVGTTSEPVYILKFGTNAQIEGKITDDDANSTAVVKQFIISDSPLAIANDGSVSGNTGIFKTWVSSSGEWIFEPATKEDGEHTIYFYAKDNKDKIFYTGNASLINAENTSAKAQPYFQFKTEPKIVNNEPVSYKSDGSSPIVSSTKVRFYADAAGTTRLKDADGKDLEDEPLSLALVLGGTKKRYVRFVIQAHDANGINKINFTMNGKKNASPDQDEKIELETPSEWNGKSGKSSNSPAEWITGVVDVSTFATGSISCVAIAHDTSDLQGNVTPTFKVDYDGPVIADLSPLPSNEVTGKISVSGTNTDIGAGVASVKYLIPSKAMQSKTDSELYDQTDSWKDNLAAEASINRWQFDFDGTNNPLLSLYDRDAEKTNDLNTYHTAVTTDFIYTLPLYILAEDNLGNYTIERDYAIKHNPDGDKPKTTISYPTDKDYASSQNFAILGGTIRVTGESEVPVSTDGTSVKAVYIQIATSGTEEFDDYGETSGNDAYIASDTYGLSVVKDSDLGILSNSDAEKANITGKWWGIKVTGTSSWNIALNSDGRMNPKTGTNDIWIRACAVNTNNKLGAWSDAYCIHIDNTAPTQSAVLNQYASVPFESADSGKLKAASSTASHAYYSGMYLKGEWYLTVTLQDEASLSNVSVQQGTNPNPKYYLTESEPITDGVKRTLWIPVDMTHSSVDYSVEVTDSDGPGSHTVKTLYSLKIDNTPPEVTELKANNSTLADYLSVKESDSKFTLSGKFSDLSNGESGSGFERLAFYFVREDKYTIPGDTPEEKAFTAPCILDPLSENDGKVLISTLVNKTISDDKNSGVSYKLYGKNVEGTLKEYTFNPTNADDITNNKHIRKGGLIFAGGTYRKITDISSGTVTFDSSTGITSESGKTETAFFPYLQSIDNTNTESNPNFTNKTISVNNDDGDTMPESVSKVSSTWSWDGSVHSNNIPDGPAKLVILAFDKAGNVSGYTYQVSVENNAPRLAKLYLATDLNGDGKYTDFEFNQYNVYSSNGTMASIDSNYGYSGYREAIRIKTSNFEAGQFTVKDKLAVVPEIVGGNTSILMVYKEGATSASSVKKSIGTEITSIGKKDTSAIAGGNIGNTSTQLSVPDANAKVNASFETRYDPVNKSSLYAFELTNSQISSKYNESTKADPAGAQGVSFTFWDETEETEQGTNSLNCVAYIDDLIIDLVDEVNPATVISPFYWENQSKNSLYKGKGHIELEDDWQKSTAYDSTAESGEFDKDPKVSGKIVIEGYAYDDHRIDSIWVAFDDFTHTGYLDGTNGTKTVGGITYYKAAKYLSADGWHCAEAKMEGENCQNWSFAVDEDDSEAYFNQKGHKIKWSFSIDTAEIDDVAKVDRLARVITMDASSRENTSPTSANTSDLSDGKYNVPSYKMDVVPYISKIETKVRSASGLKDNNIRSASGKYSILANNSANTITVSGFNFSSLVAKVADKATSATSSITSTNGGTALTINAVDKNTATITNSGITKSGYLELFSNGIRALNNINNNDAHGTFAFTGTDGKAEIDDYKSMPNRVNEADFYSTKNVTLTDDRYLRFFDMHKTNTKNGYYPVMIMDGDAPVFGYVNSSGRTSDTYVMSHPADMQPQRRKFNADGTYTSNPDTTTFNTEYLASGTTWDQMAMAKDEGGRYHQVSVYNRNGASMGYFYDVYARLHTTKNGYDGRQMGTGYNGYSPDWSHYENNNALTLDAINAETAMVDRFQSIKLIAKGNSKTGNATIYQAYYDDSASKLVFRQFMVGQSAGDNSLFTGYGKTNLTENKNDKGYAEGRNEIASDASKFYDFGIATSGGNSYAVFVYYDIGVGVLKIKYSSALNGKPTQSITWTQSSIKLPDYVGQYVSMTVDGTALHIAAFDSNDSDLKYIYIPDYTKTAYTAMTVDAAGSVGNWTSIKIDKNSGHPYYNKPIIAYYNATETGGRDAIKLAVANNTVGNVKAGIDATTDYTSDGWEYMTVPSVDPAQGGSQKFQQVCLDFDSSGKPVVGYLGTNLEFGKWLDE